MFALGFMITTLLLIKLELAICFICVAIGQMLGQIEVGLTLGFIVFAVCAAAHLKVSFSMIPQLDIHSNKTMWEGVILRLKSEISTIKNFFAFRLKD